MGKRSLDDGGFGGGAADAIAAAGLGFVKSLVGDLEQVPSPTGRLRDSGSDTAGDCKGACVEGGEHLLEGRKAGNFD